MKLRRHAVLKWTGAGLCALIFAAWFASGWFGVFGMFPQIRMIFAIRSGTLILDPVAAGPTVPFSSRFRLWREDEAHRSWNWTYMDAVTPYGDRFSLVPLYLPFLAIAAPTSWLFHRDRRSARRECDGRCPKCGYDLSGLPPAAACPECGRGA